MFWGDVNDATLPPAGLAYVNHATLRRNVGIGGVTYRPTQKIFLHGDVEGGSSSGVYFRTRLYDYQKVRLKVTYQVVPSLQFAFDANVLNGHSVSAFVDSNFTLAPTRVARVSVGGSFVITSGSRPTSYFQPLAKLVLPMSKNLAWVSEWRCYGFGESFYAYESLRVRLVTTGVRITR